MTSNAEGADKVCLKVDAGVCRFRTTILAWVNDEGDVFFDIESECSYASKLSDKLSLGTPVFEIMKMPYADNVIYQCCSILPHSSCPIPSALIKAAEVAAGFGIARDVRVVFEH